MRDTPRSSEPSDRPPTTSVIIPTFERPGRTIRAARSVLGQTDGDLEVIVVDDASGPATRSAISLLSDPRVRYVRHAVNRGAAAARNTGILASRGQFVGFLDSDDEWKPGKLEAQLRVFRSNPHGERSPGVVLTGEAIIEESTGARVGAVVPALRGRVYEDFFSGRMGGNRTFLVRRECFDASGLFDERLPASQLWDIQVRLAEHFEFEFVPEELAVHYEHGDARVRNPESIARAYEILIDKYSEGIPHRHTFQASMRRTLGVSYLRLRQPGRARSWLVSSLRYVPSPRTLAYLTFTFVGRPYRLLGRLRSRLRDGWR